MTVKNSAEQIRPLRYDRGKLLDKIQDGMERAYRLKSFFLEDDCCVADAVGT
jgi:hypothetical protein